MARRPRLEVEGGLYHVITRGVDRQAIFHDEKDHAKLLSLLTTLKEKLPFYLYAYCLMTNHIHLLIERKTDDIGRIMHRVLTGYTQYYNRRYRRAGHVLQGRHKAILCQSDIYMAELVRYIHLNPVRAKMVRKIERYPYSSHRAYMGLEAAGVVDVEPMLRRFGRKKEAAREQYAQFVAAGMKLGHQEEFYETSGGILGNKEFVDSIIHRIGEFDVRAAAQRRSDLRQLPEFKADAIIRAVENVCAVSRDDFCGKGKGARVVTAREILIVSGRRLGATVTALAQLTGIAIANVSRRHDACVRKMNEDASFRAATNQVIDQYRTHDKESSKKQA